MDLARSCALFFAVAEAERTSRCNSPERVGKARLHHMEPLLHDSAGSCPAVGLADSTAQVGALPVPQRCRLQKIRRPQVLDSPVCPKPPRANPSPYIPKAR